jgi:HAD superfamily hydrolase (TIGR01549 family)
MMKNIIFDWSGTLVNDQQFTFQLTNETLIHFKAQPISFSDYVNNFKIPVDKFYSKYLPNTPIEKIDNFFFGLYKENISQIELFPKTKLLFEFALEFNLDLYICSTLNQEIIELASEKLGIKKYFKNIAGGCFNKKESLPIIIKRNRLVKDETIFIGDTPHDLEAGKESQIQAGAILYGYTPSAMMLDQNPDEAFESPADLYFKLTAIFEPNYYKKPVSTVGGIIFDEQNKALLIKTEKWSNKWGIPGGKIKFNETMVDAFIREIKEETNLNIKDIKMICIQDCIQHPEFYLPRHFLLVNYTAKAKTFDVKLNYEATEFKWVHLEEAMKMDLNQPTRTLIEKVLECKEA